MEQVAGAGHVLARCVGPPVGVAFGGETGHYGEVVLFGESVHVGDGVVPCPVETVGVVAAYGVLFVLLESVDVECVVIEVVALIPCVGAELSAEHKLLDGLDLDEGVHEHAELAAGVVHTCERACGVPLLVVVGALIVVHRVCCIPFAFGAEYGSGGVHRHGSGEEVGGVVPVLIAGSDVETGFQPGSEVVLGVEAYVHFVPVAIVELRVVAEVAEREAIDEFVVAAAHTQ